MENSFQGSMDTTPAQASFNASATPHQPKEEEDLWMQILWDRYCEQFSSSFLGNSSGTTHSGAVSLGVKSPEVNTLWGLWGPFIQRLPLYIRRDPSALEPDGIEDEAIEEMQVSPTVPSIAVNEAASRKRTREPPSSNTVVTTGLSKSSSTALSVTHVFFLPLYAAPGPHSALALLTDDLRQGLAQHPELMISLLTFFYAWMLYKGDPQVQLIAAHESPGSSSALPYGLLSRPRTDRDEKALMRRQRRVACNGLVFCCLVPPTPSPSPGGLTASTLFATVPFSRIGAGQLGRLLTVTGSIIRLSAPRVLCTAIQYLCQHCGATKWMRAEDGVLVYPGVCEGSSGLKRCKGYKWMPMTQVSKCEEVQWLKVQETISEDALLSSASTESSGAAGGGGVNKVLEVELRQPFLDRLAVGDTVMVCGVLHTRRDAGNGKGSSSGHQLSLHALSIVPYAKDNVPQSNACGASDKAVSSGSQAAATGLDAEEALQHGISAYHSILLHEKQRAGLSGVASSSLRHHSGTAAEMLLSFAERAQFFEVARHPQWFSRLTATLAPGLFGLTMVKEALILAIIGGSAGAPASSTNSSGSATFVTSPRAASHGGVRRNIHVLLLGDPGLGKSQLLRAACRLATRSAYVCAHTSSTCGLTLTLSRDPLTGEASFDAGAVVHGDGGVTGIDEIDKGTSEHKALLEVMEQESVSVAKAGVVFSMPVQTSIFAAGNPAGGSFNSYMSTNSAAGGVSLAEASKLSPALLSRFDLVICLRDCPGQPCGEWPYDSRGLQTANPSHVSSTTLTHHVLNVHRSTRQQAVQHGVSGEKILPPPLPVSLVQRFIAFARASCHPQLLPEAVGVLKAHYLEERALVRGSSFSGGERLITPRYLQSLIRLAGARAKAELRSEVTESDAVYAVALMQGCVSTVRHSPSSARSSYSSATGLSGLATEAPVVRAPRTKKSSQREMVVEALKATLVRQHSEPTGKQSSGVAHRLSRRTILEVCEEVGCRDPNAMLRQLNEYGVLLQSGEMFVLRNV